MLSEEPRPQIDDSTGGKTDDDLYLLAFEKGINLAWPVETNANLQAKQPMRITGPRLIQHSSLDGR
jgi:hypothetical protein